jgi:hypothetical protein
MDAWGRVMNIAGGRDEATIARSQWLKFTVHKPKMTEKLSWELNVILENGNKIGWIVLQSSNIIYSQAIVWEQTEGFSASIFSTQVLLSRIWGRTYLLEFVKSQIDTCVWREMVFTHCSFIAWRLDMTLVKKKKSYGVKWTPRNLLRKAPSASLA